MSREMTWGVGLVIGEHIPTRTCLEANSKALALLAAVSQQAGLVPMIEPEVLMNGEHTIARCEEITAAVLKSVFDALFDYRVALERMLLNTGMILPGADCPQQAHVAEVAEKTLCCFRRAVPAAVPGIVLLSGGQSDEVATRRLNAICRTLDVPWKLSFSFGRALQSPALKIWNGSRHKVTAAQAALHHRAKCNGFAVQGKHSEQMERENPYRADAIK